jgi:hypothetical protein
MALKIDTNQSAVAFHVNDGAQLFTYAVDARHAISNHPLEWSDKPWSREDADAARAALRDRYQRDVEDAQARNLPPPTPPPPDPEPLTAEDQAAIDEHNAAVAAAAERLDAYRARKAAENAELAQVAMDEAIIASAPPAPAPRRPFGRTGEPTAGERKLMEKQAADKAERDRIAAEKKAADDKLAADKANEDKIAGNSRS